MGSPSKPPGQLVGHMIVEPGTVVRKLYETASWFTEIRLDGGRYELRRDSRHALTYMVGTEPMPGVITDEHFPSGFGGMYYANPNDGKNVGKRTTHSLWGIYDHTLDDYDGEHGFTFEPLVEAVV